ncbi:BA75_00274T0 [Komagataella pastoris]|uniref:BA75_00274T0 n=1 Tax=Komagataella pastoris TaxID=4922 RepID=A0A1B2J9T6_PICPA|nr:BA75_00274T0 [Komagataella pastoris]
MYIRKFHCLAALSKQQINHYDILGVPPHASKDEIKKRFRQLSKKYHPDLNTHLEETDKKANHDKFIQIVNSYEVLSDDSAKTQFDRNRGVNEEQLRKAKRQEFHDRYYGDAKTYSRQPSGYYNTKKNRVHYGEGVRFRGKSQFHGEFNEPSNYDVPHFDYDKHLAKNIAYEKRFTGARGYRGGDLRSHQMTHRSINHGVRKDIFIDKESGWGGVMAGLVISFFGLSSAAWLLSTKEAKPAQQHHREPTLKTTSNVQSSSSQTDGAPSHEFAKSPESGSKSPSEKSPPENNSSNITSTLISRASR